MAVTEKNKFEEREEEEFSSSAPKKSPVCIICGAKAEFCMRGLHKNTYCKECAEAYFGLLEYLDKLGNQSPK